MIAVLILFSIYAALTGAVLRRYQVQLRNAKDSVTYWREQYDRQLQTNTTLLNSSEHRRTRYLFALPPESN